MIYPPAPMPEHPTVTSPALRALIERGFLEQVSDLPGLDAAFNAGMVTYYSGFDPTAKSMHVGNLLVIMAMRLLQQHGHRPIVVVGGATGRIGDPTGRTETRKLLDESQVSDNVARLRKQFDRLLHFDSGEANDAIMVDNADWLMRIGYIEFLRNVGRHFTVNRMIAAKTYRDRLDREQPLSFLEFNYQLVQAYDFLHLFREHGCILQVGGSDQWGNIIAGVELIRRVQAESDEGQPVEDEGEAQDSAYCWTFPLLTNADGTKMGKTLKGAVWLDGSLFSPFDYYQFWISTQDDDVAQRLRLYTDLPLEQIAELTSKRGRELNDAKAVLAYEATRLLHGEEAAEQARKASAQAFGQGEDWSALPCIEIAVAEISLVDLVVHEAVAGFKSKRDARERIKAGAVKIAGEPVTDPGMMLSATASGDEGLRLQIGPKKRLRVRLTG